MNNPMDKGVVVGGALGCGVISIVGFFIVTTLAIGVVARSDTEVQSRQSGLQIRANVTAVQGQAPVTPGTECAFIVERHPHPNLGYWCRAHIVCGASLLYGGGQAGYFSCHLEAQGGVSVVGEDRQTSAMDTDAAMAIDTGRRLLQIQDDAAGRFGAFSVVAEITSVQ
jgi:hypothetical protein